MRILELDLDTRYRIYTQTKKVLRKYQKGIISGKLTPKQFVENMLKDKSMTEILDSKSICICDFKETYGDYVETLIKIQNESFPNKRQMPACYYSRKADCSSIFKLNRLLDNCGYNLLIPSQYLTQWDIDCIEKFITTGNIDLGNEKIYNYVCKI